MKIISKYTLLFVAFISFGNSGCNNTNKTVSNNSKSGYVSLAFYNVENLFDTIDDPKTKDEEFTPSGSKKWDEERYNTKLNHLGDVFNAMNSSLPDIIGLSEIENLKVLEDLNQCPPMNDIDYSIIHQNSYDQRGIDVALMVNPEKVDIIDSNFIRPKNVKGNPMGTRSILHATLSIEGVKTHVFVNHWPSRGGDYEAKKKKRKEVATVLKTEVNKIVANDDNANIIIMGDFNDYPTNASIKKVLNAGIESDNELYNLMWNLEKNDKGSYCYKKDWGCLDQFIVSKNLLSSKTALHVAEEDVQIFQKPWMMYTNKKGESYPSRTYSRDRYFGGYSDHLPIYMVVGVN